MDTTILTDVQILVPKLVTAARATIRDGSGVAGLPADKLPGRIGHVPQNGRTLMRVYYEGNIYGAANMRTWGDRVFHAADRLTWHSGQGYPSVASGYYDPFEFERIGSLTEHHGIVLDDEEACRTLAEYLRIDVVDVAGEVMRTGIPGGVQPIPAKLGTGRRL